MSSDRSAMRKFSLSINNSSTHLSFCFTFLMLFKATSAVRELILPSFSEDSTIGVIKDEEGNLKYIDLSSFFVYDTVQNPIQSIIAGAERERVFDPDAPLTVGVGKGMAKAVSRFVRPYIDESIYLNTVNNLLVRKGVTADGRKLWNEDAPEGEKLKRALEYALIEVAPFSAKQFERLYYAGTNQPDKRGNKYELSDEIAGFYGLRAVKVDALKSLNYKINDFKESVRNTRALFTADVLKGGSISPNQIIERYITANAQRYRAFNNMQRKINAAGILDVPEDAIDALFKRRQESKNYGVIQDNFFRPFSVTKNVRKEFERVEGKLQEKFDDLQVPVGLPDYVLDILDNLKAQMENIPLGDNFYKYINPKDYMINQQSSLPQGYAPQQPMPSPNVISQQPVQFSTATGLTPTENALLSDEEKAIRLRQRGLTNYG